MTDEPTGNAEHALRRPLAQIRFSLLFLVRWGLARRSDESEALDVLARARELGLAQVADNVQDRPGFICNCCSCCCGFMEAFRRIPQTRLPAGLTYTSNYIAGVDPAACTGCGRCEVRCPVEAISMKAVRVGENRRERRVARVDPGICLGCGVCMASCPTGALTLKRRSKRVFTPKDTLERVVLMALERGKLQHLIFDNLERLDHYLLNNLLGVFLNLQPVKQVLLRKQIKSRLVATLVSGAKRLKNLPEF